MPLLPEAPPGYRRCLRCRKLVLEYSAKGNARRYCSRKCQLAYVRHKQYLRRALRRLDGFKELTPQQRISYRRFTRELAKWDELNRKEGFYARQGE
jgi:hypothetical protein